MGFTLQLLAGEYDGKQFIADLVWIIYAIMAAVEVVMALYACYIGYLFATASDEGKRRTAKSRLFKVIASAFIIVALVAALRVVDVRFTNVSGNYGANNQGSFGNGNGNAQSYTAETRILTGSGSRMGYEWADDAHPYKYVFTGSFTIKTDDVIKLPENVKVGGDKIKFVKKPNASAFDHSQYFSLSGPNAFPSSAGVNVIKAEFNSRPMSDTQLSVSYHLEVLERTYKLPCYEENGKYFIMGVIYFKFNEDGGEALATFKVQINILQNDKSNFDFERVAG